MSGVYLVCPKVVSFVPNDGVCAWVVVIPVVGVVDVPKVDPPLVPKVGVVVESVKEGVTVAAV